MIQNLFHLSFLGPCIFHHHGGLVLDLDNCRDFAGEAVACERNRMNCPIGNSMIEGEVIVAALCQMVFFPYQKLSMIDDYYDHLMAED